MGKKKTHEDYIKQLEESNRQLKVIGKYQSAKTKIKHYCLIHKEEHLATPDGILSGSGLICCRNASARDRTNKRKIEAGIKYKKILKEIGNIELVEEYDGGKKLTLHKCSKHKKEYLIQPQNILKGTLLKCCFDEEKRKRLELDRIRNEKEHDKKLKIYKKVIRLQAYINTHEKILYKCLIHKQDHYSAPVNVAKGHGLKCCRIEIQRKTAMARKSKAAKEFKDKLNKKNPNLVWIGGDYLDSNTKIKFFCKTHEYIGFSTPGNALGGKGLTCCLRASQSKNGKRMGLINGRKVDNVWRALIDKLDRKGHAWIYLFESPVKSLNKFGISNNIKKRVSIGGYGKSLIEPRFYPDRRDAVLIEQAYLIGYGSEPPKSLLEWPGHSELTKHDPDEFVEIIEELEEELVKLGRWEFAENYCDEYQVKKAKKIQSSDKEFI